MHQEKAVIIDDLYKRGANEIDPGNNSYKGLRIYALPRLHEFLAEKAIQFFQPGATLLDIAAGSGALSLRMTDLGFDVSATDYVTENFKLSDTLPFIKADLNEYFSSKYQKTFTAIMASEIIVHLENPRHFARECFKLLDSGGRLLISTPNIESVASKALFLRSSNFLWFNDIDYTNDGHMTPLSQWQIKKIFSEAGFNEIWSGSFGDSMRHLNGSFRLRVLSQIISLLSLDAPQLRGEIFVTVLEKPIKNNNIQDKQ